MLITSLSTNPRSIQLPNMVAEHSLHLWCEHCKRGQLRVILGSDFQLAWCSNCRGKASLVFKTPALQRPTLRRTYVRRWITLRNGYLILTDNGPIPIRTKRKAS